MKTELTNLAATQLFKASVCIPHRMELNTCLKGLPIKPRPFTAELRIYLDMTAPGCEERGQTAVDAAPWLRVLNSTYLDPTF